MWWLGQVNIINHPFAKPTCNMSNNCSLEIHVITRTWGQRKRRWSDSRCEGLLWQSNGGSLISPAQTDCQCQCGMSNHCGWTMLKPECPLFIPNSHEVGPKVSHDCDIPVWFSIAQKSLKIGFNFLDFQFLLLAPVSRCWKQRRFVEPMGAWKPLFQVFRRPQWRKKHSGDSAILQVS